MKIAYFTDLFLPHISGVVVFLKNLSYEMSRRGHEVVIFCPSFKKEGDNEWQENRIELFTIGSISVPMYFGVKVSLPSFKLIRKLRVFNPDVIHINHFGALCMEGLVGGRYLGKPVIGSYHTNLMEPEYLRVVKLEKFRSASKVLWRFVAGIYNKCDVVVCPTDTARNNMMKNGVRVPIKLIPYGISLDFIKGIDKNNVEKVKKKYGLGGKTTLLYVGRLSPEKDVGVLIKSFAKIFKKRRDVKLLIVGDGPMRNKLEKLRDSLGSDEGVVFAGRIENLKLISSGIYSACDVFCTASASEVQPISILEAMAAGLPIVGVTKRGVKDIIHGNGILVEPGNTDALARAMVEYIDNPKKIERDSKRSLKLAEKHELVKVGESYEKLYTALKSKL